ncbi:aspartic peptidase domain-containing protein [Blyttiomyces helicus]|uniref:Aspartic peptidase domain-containing protein n=1 Tax=Blyttiomyces helicus TaxID=388810 RepID=A0A4V1IRF8_9FUNG|nr:aspartic peptidase domain-containing protein [Blyttiomyces helicus]|eukprot:RKO89907.1 aspartic peptidase domain-containing protein [Blyttiomyces helicus]
MKSASLILSALVGTTTASTLRRPNAAAPGVKSTANLDVARARFTPKSSGVAKSSLRSYYTTVSIGNGQSFKLGSWRPVLLLGRQLHRRRRPNQLSDKSVHDAGVSFSDSYGSGSASGEVYNGPYTLAGSSVKKGYFGVSTSESGFRFQAQGLLALSFSFGADGGVTSSVGEVPITALGLKSFGFYLSNSAQGDKGTFTTNGFDAAHVAGPFSYETIDSSYWQFDVSAGNFKFGKATGDLSDGGSVTAAIADTGTTLLLIPTNTANAIWSHIGATDDGTGAGTATIPCSVAKTGPAVSFTFSNKAYAIPASQYVLNNGDGTCSAGIAGGAEGQGVSIFGDIFLRTWYSYFDITNTRIGFAKAVHL